MIQHKKLTLVLLAITLYTAQSAAQENYTLNQVLAKTKGNNPVLKSIGFNTDIAKSDVITAGLRPNPVLNNQTLQLAQSSHFAPDTKFYQPQNRQVWWQLTKPVALTNQRKYKLDVADKALSIAGKSYLDAERNILLDAGDKWLDAWYNKVTLDLFVKAKQNTDSLVQIQQIRLKNQVISASEFTRTELLSIQYDLQLKTAEQNYRNALQNLKLVMGADGEVSIDMQAPVMTMVLAAELDSIVRLSLGYRPDMQIAQGNIEMARSNIKLQKKLATPVPELGAIWNPQNTVPYVGFFATMELPFFSRNQGEIQKSKVELQQSEQSLTALQQQVETDVKNTYNTYQINRQTVDKYKDILRRSEEVLQSVKYAYTRGGTTIIDFLDAQRNWYDTGKMYYEALYNYHKSYLQLLYATGLINQL